MTPTEELMNVEEQVCKLRREQEWVLAQLYDIASDHKKLGEEGMVWKILDLAYNIKELSGDD